MSVTTSFSMTLCLFRKIFVISEYLPYICGELKKYIMETFLKGLFIGLGAIVVVGLLAVFGGTIVYWIWPVAIPVAFPGLVENGTLAPELPWWSAVCLTWLFGILIKASQTNNNKN